MNYHNTAVLVGAAVLFANVGLAAVSADEAKQLGATLTPWGAEKAGNKDGSIPAYGAAPIHAPAGWDPKTPGNQPDPFNDKPLFSITAQNYQQYADKLDHMVELFKRYPNYRMDIYPTRRTVLYPQYVIDNMLKNATGCKAINDGNTLQGCYAGVPFPIPKTGTEAMWNHLLSYSAAAEVIRAKQWIVPSSGQPVMTNYSIGWNEFTPFDPSKADKPMDPKAIYWKIRIDYAGPARQVGEKLVLLDPIDQVNVGRRAYQYIPGQRRVKLAPDLAYDTPSPVSGGGSTMDEGRGFIGAIDRYDWKLMGKKEKFIPYNNFAVSDPNVCPFDKLLSTRSFPNPDCIRWELHRVWAIKATLKPGFRHIYPTRWMYWNEDSAGIGVTENFDAAGKLYRVPFTMSYPYFAEEGQPGTTTSGLWILDLQTGAYAVSGGVAEKGLGFYPGKPPPAIYFSPEALAGEGIR